MRTMISDVLILILLGAVPALAQLPPEILADSYLLQVEQAIRNGDPARARAEIDKIMLLEKEHELNLDEEFHFRYAKAAAAADLPEQAHEAVVKYLTMAGREGAHYDEALELMNRAQESLEGSQEPQAASPSPLPSAQMTAQEPGEAELKAGGSTEAQQETAPSPPDTKAEAALGCEAWNTTEFFETATEQAVTACLEAGADVNAQHRFYGTPLHVAVVYNKNPKVIEALLAAGADVNAQNELADTPLHAAAGRNENPEVIEALLAAGADLNALDRGDGTPLHAAADSNKNPKVIEALLAAGAEVNALNRGSVTPLHAAADRNENPEVIEALLAAGADVNAQNELAETPLHAAADRNKNPKVIEALLAAGADVNAQHWLHGTPLHAAASGNENPKVIEVLLAAGADVNARTRGGETPLHRVSPRNPSAVALLLEAGARLEARDNIGRTPLHEAATNRDSGVVRALLEAGANTEARDKDGSTPLHVAARYYYGDSTHAGDAIEALLDGGADPTARNAAGKTPWDLAEENENLKGSDGYWRLNEARFNAPQRDSRHTPRSGPDPRRGAAASQPPPQGPGCEIPGYPKPANPQSLGLSWCPASVGFQVRSFALVAAGAKCAIATGSSSTTEQIQARRTEIKGYCARLAALAGRLGGGGQCLCPAGYPDRTDFVAAPAVSGVQDSDEEARRQRDEARRQKEEEERQRQAAQDAERERLRIEERNRSVLSSDCTCISIDERTGEYSCSDGFVSAPDSKKPLCDILRR